jgi:hypothetical protein
LESLLELLHLPSDSKQELEDVLIAATLSEALLDVAP